LKSAEDQLAALKALSVSDTSDTTVTKPREIAKKIEDLLKETRDHFREAIQAMKEAVGIPSDDDASDDQDDSMPVQPHKKGYSVVVTIIVLLLLILAAYLLWPAVNTTPTPSNVAPNTEQQGTQAQAEDINSLEADLDATNFEGVSGSL
jgi:hypothetical protein